MSTTDAGLASSSADCRWPGLAPMTRRGSSGPAYARLRRSSDLLIDQLRAIDNRRLVHGPPARLMCISANANARFG